MLGATFVSVLALAGGSGNLWISNEKPREGTRYRAMTLWGKAELECVAAVGRKYVPSFVYRSATHDVCVLLVPRGSAGKWLKIAFSSTDHSEAGKITHADGISYRRLIRR